MRDISLHLLDLVQNSIKAEAKQVDICFVLDHEGVLTMTIRDDGAGMSEELLKSVASPFTTTRNTRKVGLGIPLVMQNARLTGGDVWLKSKEGAGTTLTAVFHTSSIDCLPLGDLPETMATLILANPLTPEFTLTCESENGRMSFRTLEIRQALAGVMLNEPEVITWIRESLTEEIQPIMGGITL